MNATSPKPKQSTILAGILFIAVLLFLMSRIGTPAVLQMVGLVKVNATLFFVSRLLNWVCLGLLWLYCVKVEKQPIVLWPEKRYNFLTLLLSALAIIAVIIIGMIISQHILSSFKLNNKSQVLEDLFVIFRQNQWLLVFTALTAGVVEEIIFRGYLMPRLELLFNSPFLTVTISSLLFGLLHYKYGTVGNVVGPIFIGLVFGFYYWKYRNLTVLIICHFLWDVAALYISINHH